jgi:ketosteroid isomerase-like protein
MSQENVEIIHRAYALLSDWPAVRRGDHDDAYLDYFAHDAELVLPPIYPDTESAYVGLEGWKRWLQEIDDVFDDWGFEAEQILDAGQQVVVLVRTSGTAKQSRAAVTISAAHVHTLRDARVVRVEVFLDRSEALEAAGLSE